MDSYTNIVRELWCEDSEGFTKMFRMTYDTFESILRVIEQDITRHQVMGGHKVIKPEDL